MRTLSFGARGWAVLIIGFLAVVGVERGAFLARHVDVPGPSAVFQYLVLFCLIGYWLKVDSRETGHRLSSDSGFLLFLAWPVIVPYHLVKTRGLKRSLGILFLILLVYLGGSVAGMTLFRPRP